MRNVVQFLLNGREIEASAPDPTQTVLDWLRQNRRLTGTKEGCAEGDCGACTVMMVDESGRTRALNACIAFLPMIDGCAITTVEGLGGDDLVQTKMVEMHASQCGFCTPGIVMSLHAHRVRGGDTSLAGLNDCLAGNLCRCTGYGPIVRAARDACAAPAKAPLAARPSDEPLGYVVETPNGLRAFHAPRTLEQLADLCAAQPDAVILAGATDIGLWVTKQGRRPSTLISVMRVSELQSISYESGWLKIGAAVRYADAMTFLVALHPAFGAYLRRLGAAQVRDSGTIVGNIANGSPIGDMPPALIALGAEIVLRQGARERRMPLEQFFLDYGKQDRVSGEILTHVYIPPPAVGALFTVEKLSKRFDQDISAVSCGFQVRLDGGVVAEARLAFGGMAGIPKRAGRAEAALNGRHWDETNVRSAMAALDQDFQPLTDMRASSAYRLEVARNLLLRFFLESRGQTVRLSSLASVAHG